MLVCLHASKWELACKEPSLLLVLMYYVLSRKNSLLDKVLLIIPYYLLSIITSINVPRTINIGKGLRIRITMVGIVVNFIR